MNAIQTLPTPAFSTLRLTTADNFLSLPDSGKGFELVDGQLKEWTVSAKSSRIGGRILSKIELASESYGGWVFGSDATFRCYTDDPNRIRRADVALIVFERFSADQYEREGHVTVCPDLVVEVISPNDLAFEVLHKVDEWRTAGVRVVWLIDPDDKRIYVHSESGITMLRESDTLTGDPVIPGFAFPVAELFRLPQLLPKP